MKRFIVSIIAGVILITVLSGICLADSTPSSWAVREVNFARTAGIVTDAVTKDYQASITREEFCELVVKLYEILNETIADGTGNVFTDTDNIEVVKAYNLGIVSGISATEFAPGKNITRQEICTMLVRCIDKAVEAVDVKVYNENVFADIGSIKFWALPSVQFAFDNGIMLGVGDNMINPLGFTTCEQAIMLVYRVYAKFSDAPDPPSVIYTAYFDLLTDLVNKYGICGAVYENNGLFLAKLIDFNNDGVDELIYYHTTFSSDSRSGYVLYGYDKISKKAVLINDHRAEMLELYQVTVFKGQDGRIYVKNRNGQSFKYSGDFYTLEDNKWKEVLSWEEKWDSDTLIAEYSFNKEEYVDEAKAKIEFGKFENELIYEFELFDKITDERAAGNINGMLEELKLKSEQ